MNQLFIGILAHNEAGVIGRLLQDLSQQSVMQTGFTGLSVHICIVPNGCTDTTAQTSRVALAGLDLPKHVEWSVVELEPAGKTSAWNAFVHEISPDDADYLLFLDADVSLPQHDLIERSVAMLVDYPEAWVVSDESRNVFPEGSGPSLMKFLAPLFAATASGKPSGICGQFYCARARRLKSLVLPAGLLSQDGFIRAMILTSALTTTEELNRIQRVPDAYHLHPAYATLSRRYRYEKRQMVSVVVFRSVYKFLRTLPNTYEERMSEIHRLNSVDPNWVSRVVQSDSTESMMALPKRQVFNRFDRWRERPWPRRIAMAPIVFLAMLFDVFVCLRAAAELRSVPISNATKDGNRFRIRADDEVSSS